MIGMRVALVGAMTAALIVAPTASFAIVYLDGSVVVPESVASGVVVASCGAQSLSVGTGLVSPFFVTTTGSLCTNATGSGGGAITGPLGSTSTDAQSVAITASTQSVFGALTDSPCAAYNTASCSDSALLRLIAQIAGNGTGNTGSAVPGSALYLAANNGGNLTGLTATSNGLKVDGSAVTQPTSSAVNVTEHDCSVTLTTGGTAQNAFAATSTIHGFRIANVDSGHNDEVVWFSTTTTAAASTAQSYPLPPPTPTTFAGFGSYTSPPGEGVNTALSVIAATTGHVISCTYW